MDQGVSQRRIFKANRLFIIHLKMLSMFNKLGAFPQSLALVFVWLTALPLTLSAQSDEVSEKIWASLGGKQQWENARYFMFTCQGPHAQAHASPASYLWDRHTGNCRYEGTTADKGELVVLFNLNHTTGQVFIDNVAQDSAELVAKTIDNVRQGFKKDAELLFLPAIQDGKNAQLSLASERLVGASRQFVVQVKNEETVYGADAAGTIHVDAQSGRIRHWNPQRGVSYEVSGYKDIGGGLFLPTRFVAAQGRENVVYSVAAALVHIESQKFTQP